ncbi:hypothetical protein PIROE2DRAFT_12053, partial [Piromyces sp. E2]
DKSKTLTEVVYVVFTGLVIDLINDFLKDNDLILNNVTNTTDINSLFISNPLLKTENALNIGFVVPEKHNDIVNTIMNNTIFQNTTLKAMTFDSDKSMENYYNNAHSLIAGVIINPDLLSYTLRVDGSSIPDPSLLMNKGDLLTVKDNSTNYLSIFTPIQMAIDQVLIQLKTGDNNLEIASSIGRLPLLKSNHKEEFTFLDAYNVMIFMFPFFLPIIQIIYYIVSENEKNIKSFLMTIGMHPSSFWFSYLISNTLYFAFLIIILTAFLFAYHVFPFKVLFIIVVHLFIFSISLVSFSFLFSNFFNDSKVAYSCADFFLSFISFSYLFFYFCSRTVKIIGGFFISPVSLGFVLERILYLKKNSDLDGNIFMDKDILIGLGMLIWNCISYFVLAIIFDSIKSEENQSFISFKKNLKSTFTYDDQAQSPYEKDIEEYHGSETSFVEVKNISREFINKKKNFLAVNNVSFKAYKDEIFYILGHNGAGKSTLIKIMTGLIRANHGCVLFDGDGLEKNATKIRHNIGTYHQ